MKLSYWPKSLKKNKMIGLQPITIGLFLQQHVNKHSLSRIDLKALLAWATGLTQTQLITQSNRKLNSLELNQLEQAIQRRTQGEPLAYITNQKEFYSRTFYITPDVLVPRPETEELIDQVLTLLQAQPTAPYCIADIGCGSGVIGITLAAELPLSTVIAIDCSSKALQVAQQNAHQLKVHNIHFYLSNIFSYFETHTPTLQFDLIVSNPPYLAHNDPHLEQPELKHEPQIALTDQADGYSFYRQLAQESPKWLKNQGYLLIEHGYTQQQQILSYLEANHWGKTTPFTDLAGLPRMILAQK